ncbi:MAG: DUF1684 domain-containing protein [Acidobacteriota bacterium]|nr:DUF1684 domain-containing protein [Acidobacteriota bacterium]
MHSLPYDPSLEIEMRWKELTTCLLISVLLGCQVPVDEVDGAEVLSPPEPDYIAEVEEWRSDREERLRRPDGWLSLAGLFWLEEGENRFGSAPDNDLVFPMPAPAYLGRLRRSNNEVWVEFEAGNPEKPLEGSAEPALLALDSSDEPTILEYETLSFFAIERGERIGIRLKDSASEVLRTFRGMDSYAVDPAWRLDARFVAYDEPRTVQVPNVIGGAFDESAPGRLELSIDGREVHLEPIVDLSDPEASLFLVFGDETNGDETYGGGRFLYIDPPGPDGWAVVDFNKAYNPPCVFTPYATCPLPRPENKLALRIEAGEKSFHAGVH